MVQLCSHHYFPSCGHSTVSKLYFTTQNVLQTSLARRNNTISKRSDLNSTTPPAHKHTLPGVPFVASLITPAGLSILFLGQCRLSSSKTPHRRRQSLTLPHFLCHHHFGTPPLPSFLQSPLQIQANLVSACRLLLSRDQTKDGRTSPGCSPSPVVPSTRHGK